MAPQDLSSEFFRVTVPAPFVAQVEINRPQKLNSFTGPMFTALGAIFTALSSDSDVRAIILTAAGDRAFTAGLDVNAASNLSAEAKVDVARHAFEFRRHALITQDTVTAIDACAKPVICVLHGISYGGAIDISTACDVRLCAKDTRFAVREVEIGLAADLGTLSRLPRIGVPYSWMKDVCLTARDFSAQEALSVGFVSGVYETKQKTLDRALELASLIASKSPVAVQGTKSVINYSREHTIKDGLDYVAVWNAAMVQTDDVKKALQAGLQKRKVTFEKL